MSDPTIYILPPLNSFDSMNALAVRLKEVLVPLAQSGKMTNFLVQKQDVPGRENSYAIRIQSSHSRDLSEIVALCSDCKVVPGATFTPEI